MYVCVSLFNLTSFLLFQFYTGVSCHKIEEYLLGFFTFKRTNVKTYLATNMNANIAYNHHASPFYVWIAFIIYNWFQTNIGLYTLLHSIVSIDYRLLLIAMNFIGLYIFLRNARIDFTIRVRMNQD